MHLKEVNLAHLQSPQTFLGAPGHRLRSEIEPFAKIEFVATDFSTDKVLAPWNITQSSAEEDLRRPLAVPVSGINVVDALLEYSIAEERDGSQEEKILLLYKRNISFLTSKIFAPQTRLDHHTRSRIQSHRD